MPPTVRTVGMVSGLRSLACLTAFQRSTPPLFDLIDLIDSLLASLKYVAISLLKSLMSFRSEIDPPDLAFLNRFYLLLIFDLIWRGIFSLLGLTLPLPPTRGQIESIALRMTSSRTFQCCCTSASVHELGTKLQIHSALDKVGQLSNFSKIFLQYFSHHEPMFSLRFLF